MSDFNNDRRKLIKNIVIAGFGIHLVGCSSKPSTTSEQTEKPQVLPTDPIPEIVDKIEAEVIENNVTYFTKLDESFEKLATYFNLHTTKSPKIIALVNNSKGVSEAIRYAKINKLPVAVKSGGHSFEQFSSNIDGLVINLSLLNTFEWKENHQLKAGPACLLKEVYEETLPKGRILPAGSCATVGLGGLVLGGGYGLFSRKYGLTCDHLISATFVDGNGEIHEVDKHHELLWALRGGGNGNFGVVTSMTFETQPIPTKFETRKFKAYKLDPIRAKQIFEQWFTLAKNLPESYFSAFVLNGNALTILVTFYEGYSPELEILEQALTPITDKQTKSTTTDIAKQLTYYYGIQNPLYFKNASAGYYNEMTDIEGCIDAVLERVVNTKGLIYQVNTLGKNINSPLFEKRSAYPHRSYEYLSELQSYWNEGQDAKRDRLLSAFEDIQQLFYDNGNHAQYRNYPSLGFPDWANSYYGENLTRLKKIKLKYDPKNTVRHDQSIPTS
ncbi:MAG: FAD-binding protein [Crocinitomicaceae bacterium]|nr:FAD-binding protein [Crocinitomicaceae bacterium]